MGTGNQTTRGVVIEETTLDVQVAQPSAHLGYSLAPAGSSRMGNLIGKRVLIVDEGDDTRTTQGVSPIACSVFDLWLYTIL